MAAYKRFEFWGSEKGKPVKKFTNWFAWNDESEDQWQLKGKLKNEYKN